MSLFNPLKELKNLLIQNYCSHCGRIDELICDNCIKILLNSPKVGYLYNVPVYCLTKNIEIFKQLIIEHKDGGYHKLSIPFSKMLAQGLKILSVKNQTNILNVPTSAFAIKKRGLDPVAIMTENACMLAGKRFNYTPEYLINARPRMDQVDLNFNERRINLEKAFKSPQKSSKSFVIVDDVITTGASMSSSILAMQSRGNHVKACLVLAWT